MEMFDRLKLWVEIEKFKEVNYILLNISKGMLAAFFSCARVMSGINMYHIITTVYMLARHLGLNSVTVLRWSSPQILLLRPRRKLLINWIADARW